MSRGPRFVFYLAVLPHYRQQAFRLLSQQLEQDLMVCCSVEHLEPTVQTKVSGSYLRSVRMVRIFGKGFIQIGYWKEALSAECTVVDLNPRSGTSWLLLVLRRLKRRRTLAWGHLYGRRGAGDRRGWARLLMRRLAAGTVLYDYSSLTPAKRDHDQALWVAPNALYRRDQLDKPAARAKDVRKTVLYVGRLEPEKKVDFLVEGFLASDLARDGFRLILIGKGSLEPKLRELAERRNAAVVFPGELLSAEELRPYYANAICSVSPGFAGLGLTQSVGFGVPMLIADNEPHSPEIELAGTGAVKYFRSDSVEDLAHGLETLASNQPSYETRLGWSSYIAEWYSAEAMAAGFVNALLGVSPEEVAT